MPINPVIRRLGQEDYNFQASLELREEGFVSKNYKIMITTNQTILFHSPFYIYNKATLEGKHTLTKVCPSYLSVPNSAACLFSEVYCLGNRILPPCHPSQRSCPLRLLPVSLIPPNCSGEKANLLRVLCQPRSDAAVASPLCPIAIN